MSTTPVNPLTTSIEGPAPAMEVAVDMALPGRCGRPGTIRSLSAELLKQTGCQDLPPRRTRHPRRRVLSGWELRFFEMNGIRPYRRWMPGAPSVHS